MLTSAGEAGACAPPEAALHGYFEDAEPTLRELRWVGVEELKETNLLPVPLKKRLLEDAPGWVPAGVYLRGGRR